MGQFSFFFGDPCNTNPARFTEEASSVMLTHQRDGQLATKQRVDTLNLSFQQLLLLASRNPSGGRLRGNVAED